MSRVIAENNVEPSFMIDDYSFYVQNGVKTINIQHRNHYGWDIEYENIEDKDVEVIYYYIDGIYDEAFPHWTLESGIYLHIFSKLKELYPSIKLLSFRNKNFKQIEYAAYNIDSSEISNKIETPNNKIVFIKCCSQADHTECELYLTHVRRWYNYLKSLKPVVKKDIEILYLPRGTLENYHGTDRIIPVQRDLVQVMEEFPGAVIYLTDTTKNMADQVNLVRRAKIIILNEGGSHGVNGFFAENSKIIVLGGHGNSCHFQNPRPALVYYDSIKRGNQYFHLDYNDNIMKVLDTIQRIKVKELQPVNTPAVTCWRDDWKGCIPCNTNKWRYPDSLDKLDKTK